MSQLVELRRIAPDRALTRAEAFSVAELQANRLLDHTGLFGPPVPTTVIRDLPAVKVDFWSGTPVSGSTHWTGSNWIIVLNADEPGVRKRFTMAHELHHILEHPARSLRSTRKRCGKPLEELVADHFAACLLMPKMWVRRAILSEGIATVSELAWLFEVSRSAMQRRLSYLGLLDDVTEEGRP